MKKEEFIELAPKCGYGKKEAAKKYVEEHPKDDYDTEDFKALYETSMHWSGVSSDMGLRYVYGVNGKTTAMSNGIAGTSSVGQDWKM